MLLNSSAFPSSQVNASTLDSSLPESPSALPQSSNIQQLIVVDSAVQDYESLLVGIEESTQVVVLNPDQDGVRQITTILEQYENLSSVQVLAHGDVGMTQLGSTILAANTLDTYANDIQQWGNALTDHGDLLFFGCNIAGNAEGYAFVEAISQLSGADVAASDDLTGSGQNGDWEQEVHIGTVEAESAIAPHAQAAYAHLLALPSTDDLVMTLNFNETSGTTAFDSSSNGLNNNGVLQNGAAFRDEGAPYGGVVDFDGVDDYISLGDSTDINIGPPRDERTISVWFNANDINTSTQKQVLYEEGGSSRGFNLYIDNGQLYVGGWNLIESGWTGTYLSTNTINSNTWHHVALVLDAAPGDTSVQSNVFTAYLDGVQFGQGDGSQIWAHGNDTSLGAINEGTRFHDGPSSGTSSQAFAGSLADTYLYNRALDTSEIGLLADATNLPPASLDTNFVMHLTLDETSGSQAADTSPAGLNNPGTLQNGAQFEPVGADLGNGVRLDGNDDYIQVGNSSNINLGNPKAQRTVTAWFNFDDVNIADRKQVVFEEGGISRGLNIYVDNGQLYVGGWNVPESNWTGTFLSTNGISSNTWHHVALVLDAAPGNTTVQSNVFTAYLDGVAFGQGDGSQVWAHGDGVAFGAINSATLFHDESVIGTGTEAAAGVIADGQLYNRVLSASEIQALAAINVPGGSDTTPPTASVTAPDLTTGGTSTYDFTVTFSDNTAIDVSTLDNSDVLVTGPNSFSQVATFVSVDVNTDGTPRTATYQLNAPNVTWESTDNGTYTVDLVADQVSDTSANAAIASTLGTFDVNITPTDTTPPTATVTASDLTTGGTSTYDFTVTFSDDTAIDVSTLDSSDVLVTGPNSFSQVATFISVDVNTDGTPRTATYQLTAPNVTWESTDNGTYTVDLVADQVSDTSENTAIASTLGTFDVNITPSDTTPPTATVTAPDLTTAGTSTYDFTITFDDDTAVDVSTLDNSDVLVTGPNSFSQVATFVSVDVNTDGTPRTATYQLTAPNVTWETTDNGTYTVDLVTDQVSDTSGNTAIATTLGTFDVAIASADNDFVMHLTLDEPSGTIAADSSPSGLDNFGTLQNGAQFEPVGLDLGGGVRLDGNNDYILVDNSTDIDEGSPKAKRTIAVWFRADDVSIDSRKQVIFEEGGSGRGLNIYLEDGQLYVGGWNLQESGWNGTFLSTNTVASSTWQHVALVLDADPGNTTVQTGVFKAYLNGALFGIGDGSQVWAHGDGNGLGAISGGSRFHDGSVFGPGTQAMAGVIADGRLYNRALSDTEIQSLAALNVPAPNDGTPPSPTLSASNITTSGAGTYTFTVTYTDEAGASPSTAVDVSTLDNSDIEIKGPNGFRQFATFVSVDNNTDGLTRTATYQINTPGGSWDVNDSGTYYAIIQDKEVSDVASNTVPSQLLGTFEVDLIPANSPIAFTEVTDAAGLTNVGSSFGASWGDFNGDGLPDLWVSNHGKPSILYQNNGDGTFTDAANTAFTQSPTFGDTHGQAWADFDNDGDEDVIVLVGGGSGTGSGANRLYVNNNGVFTEQAAAYGLEYAAGRGRTPVWIDYDNDGLLDLWISNLVRPDGQAPPTIFRQTSNGTFEDVGTTTNIEVANSEFAALGDFTGDGTLDILSRGFNPARNFEELTIYDPSTIPFQDVSDALIATDLTGASDFAVADFNNDLQPDVFIARNDQIADINQETTTLLEVDLISLSSELGLEFTSSGDITFDLTETGSFALNEIFIGATGINPTSKEFTLSASDPNVEGILTHAGGSDKGIYIGYDSVEQQWRVLASSDLWANTKAGIHVAHANGSCNCSLCNGVITNINSIGFDDNAPSLHDQLLINSAQGLINQTQSSGLNDISNFSESVVAGDFDNDMDVDLYVLSTDRVTNRSNILYENQGDGTFAAVAGAGGASGSLLGVGDSVTTVDYDGDGFLDLFVTNGADPRPYNEDGPNQLFRNEGNGNHWIQIDLSGIAANRDGIGAQIFVTAGGVTQMREMSGGVHKFAQNHDRIHFGLAGNDTIDEIVIRWPSGTEQTLTNVSADQVLTILEDV